VPVVWGAAVRERVHGVALTFHEATNRWALARKKLNSNVKCSFKRINLRDVGVVFEQEGGGAAHVVVRRRDAEEVGGNAGCVTLSGGGTRAQAREKLLRGSSGGRLPDDVKEERLVGGVCGAALRRGKFLKERHASRRGWVRHEMRWRPLAVWRCNHVKRRLPI
jgi:hypothetical protein